MKTIYRKKNYAIYSDYNGSFIAHNTKHKFIDWEKKHHTHINNFNTAKYIINLAMYSSLPEKKVSNYILDSIIRISDDKEYIKKLEELKTNKNHLGN